MPVPAGDTAEALEARVAAMEPGFFVETLARIAAGEIDEHPAYEHYLAARILADTHAAARQVVGSKLQEINRG